MSDEVVEVFTAPATVVEVFMGIPGAPGAPGEGGGGSGAWGGITGTLSAQTDLQAALDAKSATGHGHAQSDVTGLTAALTAKADASAVTTALSGKADTSHNHAASAITSGTIDAARLDANAAVNTVAATGSTETLSAAYQMHKVTMDQNCTFTFTSPAAGAIFAVLLSGAFVATWPASVKWPDATLPTYSTPALYVFATFDGGTTWDGVQSGKAFA